MSEKFTPTEEQVREALRSAVLHPDDLDFDNAPGLAFDRFMAGVRREAKAKALREAADAYSNYEGGDNEHVVRLWLRMRAESIENEGDR